MNDDDYRALIAAVIEELRASGASDVADERHYTYVDKETGETHLLRPQQRLVEMLQAFDRFLVIQDREIYDLALSLIAQTVQGEGPLHASMVLTADNAPREIDLSKAPNLSPVRQQLQNLIVRLLDGDLRPS